LLDVIVLRFIRLLRFLERPQEVMAIFIRVEHDSLDLSLFEKQLLVQFLVTFSKILNFLSDFVDRLSFKIITFILFPLVPVGFSGHYSLGALLH